MTRFLEKEELVSICQIVFGFVDSRDFLWTVPISSKSFNPDAEYFVMWASTGAKMKLKWENAQFDGSFIYLMDEWDCMIQLKAVVSVEIKKLIDQK